VSDARQLASAALAEDLSNQAHRRVIGFLGLILPGALYLLAGLRPTHGLPRWTPLESLSAYYYSGAVALFVGVVFSLSLFLVTYRGYKGVPADRIVGALGGASAMVVALFPTWPPCDGCRPSWWTEPQGVAHNIAAALLFTSFILFSLWLFRKSSIPKRKDRPREKRIRDDVCLACGVVMIGSVLWAASTMITHAPIFVPESIAVEAFAISWLAKGDAHGEMLRLFSRGARRATAPTAASSPG
jgi:hypothetical protein